MLLLTLPLVLAVAAVPGESATRDLLARASAVRPGELAMTIRCWPADRVATLGEPIYLTVTLTNTTERPLRLAFSGVSDLRLALVGAGRRFESPPRPPEIHMLVGVYGAEPGGVLFDQPDVLGRYLQPDAPGEYQLTAELRGGRDAPPLATASAPLVIGPRDPDRLGAIAEALFIRTRTRLLRGHDPSAVLPVYAAYPPDEWRQLDHLAYDALSTLGDPAALPYLAQLALFERQPRWCEAIARIDSPAARDTLAALATARSADIREAARQYAAPAEPAPTLEPADVPREPWLARARLEVAASRLLRDLPAELMAQRDKGYLRVDQLDALSQKRFRELMAVRAGRQPGDGPDDDEPLTGYRLGLWASYRLLLRDDRVVPPRLYWAAPFEWLFGTPPLPAAFGDGGLGGSARWWTWPYAAAPWAEAPAPELAPGGYPLADLLALISRECGVRLNVAHDPLVDPRREVYLNKQPASLGELLWSIEGATGLELVPEVADPLSAEYRVRRGTERQEGETHWASLPGCGYVSPERTTAGSELLATGSVGDAGLPALCAWRLNSLPPVWTRAIAELLLRPPGDPQLPGDQIELLWIGGIMVSVRIGDAPGTTGWMTFLP